MTKSGVLSKVAMACVVAIAICGASAADAATAVDVPGQVFVQKPGGAEPVANFSRRPDASLPGRDWAVGRSFRVSVPVGARERLPFKLHIYSSEEVCHDATDVTARAANRDQDFIRGGDH